MRLTIETVCVIVVHVALQHAILRSRVWRRVEIADGNLRREKADGNSDSFSSFVSYFITFNKNKSMVML